MTMLCRLGADLFAITCLALPALPVCAAKVPNPGQTDHRIRSVDYNPLQVYRITGYYGYALTVLFDRSETIEQVILGDPNGWEVTTKHFVLSLKPKAQDPDTSMVVLTNQREYAFDLRAKPPRKSASGQAEDKDQAFLVRFAYPSQAAARIAASRAQVAAERMAKEQAAKQLEAERRVVANMPAKPINRHYSYSGAAQLAPMEVWDDGHFTYLRFSAQQGIPAIYTQSLSGDEMIAPKHFERDVTVIQYLAKKIILRRGDLVTCVWNEAPIRQTQYRASGASDPASARIDRPARMNANAAPVLRSVPHTKHKTRIQVTPLPARPITKLPLPAKAPTPKLPSSKPRKSVPEVPDKQITQPGSSQHSPGKRLAPNPAIANGQPPANRSVRRKDAVTIQPAVLSTVE